MSSTAWSNDYLVECLCNRSVYQIPVTGVSQIHLILNFNLTIPNIKIYGNGLPSFFFQRWTIIKYRHIGIFYNHLGGKKTYGVDSHKLCPIFLHKKHITIYCNLIYHSHQKNPKHLTYDAKPKCPFTSCCVHETRWKWQHDHWKLNLINF